MAWFNYDRTRFSRPDHPSSMNETRKSMNTGEHDRMIARGAFVNVLGIIGKGMMFVFFILGTRLFGPKIMGVYFLVFTIIDVAINLTVSGFENGILMFASRYTDDKGKKDRLYRVLANGFVISIFISFMLIAAAHFGGPELLLAKYPQADLVWSVRLIFWSLPFVVILMVVIAATKSQLTMKWEAILSGYVRPGLLIGFALIFFYLDAGLSGLIWGYLITQIILSVIALFIFGRYFSYRELFSHLKRFKLFGNLMTFAIPQNLNMTFNTLITNLDVIMLGYFGFAPELIIFYGMGARVVRNIRITKLAFSGSYAPVIARLYERGSTGEMNRTFSMVSRWTTTIGLPLALTVGLLRKDLLLLFHDTFTFDATFMLLLLIPPVLSCCFGLAGNIVVMTGHSKWNLFNSMTVGGLNAVLNYLLIPGFGFMGAAAATVIASAIITLLQLIEARYLIKARLSVSLIYKPYVAMVISSLVAATLAGAFELDSYFWARITVAICAIGVFIAVLFALGIDPSDKAAIAPKMFSKSKVDENKRS